VGAKASRGTGGDGAAGGSGAGRERGRVLPIVEMLVAVSLASNAKVVLRCTRHIQIVVDVSCSEQCLTPVILLAPIGLLEC